ncbi:hypothetical protein Tco_0582537, partial [Tanacetum coccineum]
VNEARGAKDTLGILFWGRFTVSSDEEPEHKWGSTSTRGCPPTALSPSYIVDFDPEEDEEDPKEDPVDHPVDGGDNE